MTIKAYFIFFLEASVFGGVPLFVGQSHLQCNCSILSLPLYVFLVAVASVSCWRRCLRSAIKAIFSLLRSFFSVACAEFQVGVLAPEEFRWKIFPGEDFQPLGACFCVSFACEIARDAPLVNWVTFEESAVMIVRHVCLETQNAPWRQGGHKRYIYIYS